MTEILLKSDTWKIYCDPDMGAQWVAAQVRQGNSWHAVMPDCRAIAEPRAGQSTDSPLSAANFHMLPYSNRIRDGLFEFQGQSIQLERADAHAIHGALRKLAWQVEDSEEALLNCHFDSDDHAGINWPWPIKASIELRLEGPTLHSQISLTNTGDADMPAGFGWHPYFNRNVNGSHATLTLPVNGVFPDANGDCLPDGPAVALPEPLDFRQAKVLDPNQRIDCCLSGLNDNCIIDWKDAGLKLVMTASAECEYLVLYNPDAPHFAVEPVTNANDAFNLSSQSIPSGTRVLAPGESLNAQLSITAEVSE